MSIVSMAQGVKVQTAMSPLASPETRLSLLTAIDRLIEHANVGPSKSKSDDYLVSVPLFCRSDRGG